MSSDITRCSEILHTYKINIILHSGNFNKTLQLFTTIPVTSCSCERAFSKLNIVNNSSHTYKEAKVLCEFHIIENCIIIHSQKQAITLRDSLTTVAIFETRIHIFDYKSGSLLGYQSYPQSKGKTSVVTYEPHRVMTRGPSNHLNSDKF
ncbi:Dimer Tnp hAT domain-containing protein [Aphis craccivora]|uniref:Dimer Tnp hAT domain-containing protein n=1 Tax=Aphis craccivora TaxID=307492 RepID=A0A6G0W3M2_APHCR|nr:Dimer Tnp hAT domain-containing protein [Aphis craccivora]